MTSSQDSGKSSPALPHFTSSQDAGALGRELVTHMHRMTLDRIGEMGLVNARYNEAYLDRGQSIAALRDEVVGEGDSAVIVAAGPSVRRRQPVERLREAGYKGAVIATESALLNCLRNDLIPDLVVSLDPHALRIVRWFGDPTLDQHRIDADDYYRRQDMDESFANEMETNRQIMELLDRHGSKIRIALATSASAMVAERVLDVGMKIYWWNPMYDDPDAPDSATRDLIRRNRLPAINAGGNVGTACWMMAHAVLGKKRVALTGVDLGYYAETPFKQTQYYHEAVDLVGEENLTSLFIPVYNPYVEKWFYTDPTCFWYRDAFLELAEDADCRTFNCTEGGIVFGDSVEFVPLDEFLAHHA